MDYTNNFKTVPVKVTRYELIRLMLALDVIIADGSSYDEYGMQTLGKIHDKLREQLDAWDKKQEELKGKGW